MAENPRKVNFDKNFGAKQGNMGQNTEWANGGRFELNHPVHKGIAIAEDSTRSIENWTYQFLMGRVRMVG